MKRPNYHIRQLFGWAALIIIALIPAFLWYFLGPGATETFDYASVTHSLGELFGLIGMTLFALTFVLSTRMKWMEDVFGGLDRAYITHGILGGTALILILAHPIFLVIKFIPSNITQAAIYLMPGSYWSVNFGIIALLGMIALIFVTLFVKMKYHNWKFTHEFLGLVFLFAVFHIFLVRGDASADNIFTGYYVYAAIVSFIGLAAFSYSLFLKDRMQKNAVYLIDKIEQSRDTFEITMTPEHKPLDYHAGQFVFVRFYNKKLSKEPHPFSIASKSGSQKMVIIVKKLGDFTKDLQHLKVGDKVSLEGPYGRFHFKRAGDNDQVWLAAGIGITPFLGMSEDLSHPNYLKCKADLYYTAKDSSDFLGYDTLSEAATKNKNFRFFAWDSSKKGRISVKDIAKSTTGLKERDIFLCGPSGFKETLIKELIEMGVKKSRIHEEAFDFI